jgi:hypothetical protein
MTDDLATRSARDYLSKSFMTGAEWCGQAAWFDLWQPRPWQPDEAVIFGSAVDRGVQVVIEYGRMGQPVDMDRAMEAAAAVITESAVLVDVNGVEDAIASFVSVPFDWTFASVQHHIRLDVPGIGMVDAHPDVILRDGSIWDIKTGKRAKAADAAARSYRELGFYALLREFETGQRPPEVGYLTWTRTKTPGWQQVYAPVTDEMLAKTRYIARQVVSAIARSNPDLNDTFTNGPAWPGKCLTCQYNPRLGGTCLLAEQREEAAA